ncbi:hypothetical protein LEN26_019895 [Aphanomyces euteiches]|nr:hypothetical protein LEN26_019895 [Aphanomyces euteiches]
MQPRKRVKEREFVPLEEGLISQIQLNDFKFCSPGPSSTTGTVGYSCNHKTTEFTWSYGTHASSGKAQVQEGYRHSEATNEKTTAPAIMPATTQTRTAADIQQIISQLNIDDVNDHFDHEAGPFVVCDGVSVDALNEYVADGEELRFALRFLDLADDGRLLIVELSSIAHESTKMEFHDEFVAASGNRHVFAHRGSTTSRRAGTHSKEADTSYGPNQATPNRTPPPPSRTIADWMTLAVEIGRSQEWESLTSAATWWAGYIGIQYVLLLKVNANATELEYRLYDIVIPGPLPDAPTANGIVRREEMPNPADIVSFSMRRVLSIPENEALPEQVNEVANVNLRRVLDRAYLSL